jgi:hypothetical protein
VTNVNNDELMRKLINKKLLEVGITTPDLLGVQKLISMHERRGRDLHDTKNELMGALTRLYRILNLAIQADLTRDANEPQPEWITTIFRVTAPDDDRDPQRYWSEAEARVALSREVYDFAQKIYDDAENKSLGNALRAVINEAGSQLGKMPAKEE